ncbi:MAG: hypothetical protein SNF33_04620 [Candidatus Algichlamydia australiensis]|nr:hypothetical protein [Chlamydiales bacterium]
MLNPINSLWCVREYCSKGSIEQSLPVNIEDGVNLIRRLLDKDVICRHDLKKVNQTYEKIDDLEKRAHQISRNGSYEVVELVANRVILLLNQQRIGAKELISLYQLQQFSQLKETISTCFGHKRREFFDNSSTIEELARHMPCCISTSNFEEEIVSLFGSHTRNEKTNGILDEKRRDIQAHEDRLRQIEERKSELARMRRANPGQYPPYFDELLEYGYLSLYDHLLRMRVFSSGSEREAAIRRSAFSSISLIIAETREAIIRKVENSIPANARDIVFLLGGARSGKSTTFCFLRGDRMQKIGDSFYESINDNGAIIGNRENMSSTFLPNIQVSGDVVIVDFPGFSDFGGQPTEIGIEFALKALIARYNPKILILEPITNINDGYASMQRLNMRISRILSDTSSCMLGVTKYSRNPAVIRIQQLESASPSPDEIAIESGIRALSELHLPNLERSIEEQQRELHRRLLELQQRRQNQQRRELRECQEAIRTIEDNLLRESGLGTIVRLKNLEDRDYLDECLSVIRNHPQSGRVNTIHTLSSENREFLREMINADLLEKARAENGYCDQFESVSEFEQSVRRHSLVKTIFSYSKPEIGKFFHLPEMETSLVTYVDKLIVSECIDSYVRYIVNKIDFRQTRYVLDRLRERLGEEGTQNAESELNAIQDYICRLENIEPRDIDDLGAKWEQIQRQNLEAINRFSRNLETELGWTGLGKFFACLPFGIPFGLDRYIPDQQIRQSIEAYSASRVLENLESEYKSLFQTRNSLMKLRNIRNFISAHGEISNTLQANPLDLSSVENFVSSVNRRVNEARNLCGRDEWDTSMSFLANRLESFFREVQNTHIPFFGGAAAISLLLYIQEGLAYDFIQIEGENSTFQQLLELYETRSSGELLFVRNNGRLFSMGRCAELKNEINAGTFPNAPRNWQSVLKVLKWDRFVRHDRVTAAFAGFVHVREAAQSSYSDFRAANVDAISKACDANRANSDDTVARVRDEAENVYLAKSEIINRCLNMLDQASPAGNTRDPIDYARYNTIYFNCSEIALAYARYANAVSANNPSLNTSNLAYKAFSAYTKAANIAAIAAASAGYSFDRIGEDSRRLVSGVVDLGINPIDWVRKTLGGRWFGSDFEISSQLQEAGLDNTLANELLRTGRVFIANTTAINQVEDVGLYRSVDQLSICDLWKCFSEALSDLDIDFRLPLSKVLLEAVILRECPLKITNEEVV